MSEVRRDGYNYHNTYVESVEWQRDKAYARAEKLVDKLSALAANGPCGKHENAVYMSDASGTWCRVCAAEARVKKLMEYIRVAPHGGMCASIEHLNPYYADHPRPLCDCWKAAALEEIEGVKK